MKGYSIREVSPGLYELATPIRTMILDGNETNTILDYFREREWENGIRDAISVECYDEYVPDVEKLVADCLEEIRSEHEIYGEFNGDYKEVVAYILEIEEE